MSIISVIMPFSIITQDKSILVKNTGSAYPDTFIVVGINCVATMSYVFFGVVHSWAAPFFISENMESREVTALFIGNRDCYNVSKTDIENAVIKAIGSGIRVFLNGGQGYFDKTCASVLYHLKPNLPTIKSYLIIPYQTFKSYNKDMYDEIIYPFEQHIESYYTYMGNIEKRNRWMVDHSCMAICYLNHTTGGAGKTFAYAKKKELTIIDLKAGEAGG